MPTKDKPKKKQSIAKKLKKLGKAVKKDAKAAAKDAGKSVYKRAKNGRVYKLVNKRPRFVSKKEADANGFGAKLPKLPKTTKTKKKVKTKPRPVAEEAKEA